MVAIKAHFDGSTIQLPPELRNAKPGEVLIVMQDSMVEETTPASNPALPQRSIWDAFGKASTQRSKEDIDQQINADRDEWDRKAETGAGALFVSTQ